jgi:hypothetical protein
MNPSNGAPSRRCFRPCARRKNLPLTLPVATPVEPKLPGHRQSRFRRLFVKRSGFPGPERLPPTSCPLGAPLSRRPSNASPPPCLELCRSGRLPTLFRPLVEEGLDSAASAGSSPAGARCHAPLVDFCNRNDPQARPANRWNPVPCARTTNLRPLRDPREGSPSPFGAAKPSGHGSGADIDSGFRLVSSAPLGALARVESFAPTRLARTPRVVGSRYRRPEGPTQSLEPTKRPAPLSRDHRPRERAFASFSSRAASRAFPRRNTRSAAPEVPSVAEPPRWGEAFLHMLSPTCGVGAWRLCYLRSFPVIDE